MCKINWKIILIQQITLIHCQNRRTNIVNSPESIVCLTYTRWCFLNNLENGTEISMKLRESASKFDEKSKTARGHLDKINERSVKEGIKWNEQGQMKILQLWGTLPRSKKEDRDHFYQKEFKAWNVIINSPLLLKWVSTTYIHVCNLWTHWVFPVLFIWCYHLIMVTVFGAGYWECNREP